MKLTKTYRRLVRGTTINDLTLLSTDYLNHFNELVMLVEMAADMPEMLEDAADWRFKTYQQHFADSVFTHKDLAVWAYEHAPEAWRAPLDRCTAALRQRIEETLPHLQALQQSGDAAAFAAEARRFAREVTGRLEAMSALINGAVDAEEAAALGAAAEVAWSEEPTEETREPSAEARLMGQSDIDRLFD
ncbi:MAG: hypothetical protein NXI21_12515 [Alphaproteobacteria bacterium]|nr:hypothetical protein [Alphaproteobacteria bacterium]